MIINEAEQIYQADKKWCEEQLQKSKKRTRIAGTFFGLLFLVVGIVLLVWGNNIPPTVDSFGFSSDNNIIQIMFGTISIIWACGILAFCFIVPLFSKVNYLPANKQLYMNYLRCTDIGDGDKEYYKEKLAEIRNAELSNTIRRSSASIDAAIMLDLIK